MSNIHNSLGPITSAFDSYLLLRSLKTLVVRMERHNKSAFEIANYLKKQRYQKCNLSRLKNHPQHKLSSKQMNGLGGISFEIKVTYPKLNLF